jgi:hypothetical protein
MYTRSATAASSSKRKRRSASTAPAESPVKRRTTRGAGASVPVADPPTLVPMAPPLGGQWCVSLRSGRDAGKFIDVELLVGGCKHSRT